MTLSPQTIAAAQLDAAARAEIVALCERAFGEDFSQFFARMPGLTCVLLRDDDGRLLSHASWLERWLQPAGLPVLCTAYVEAVATEPEVQRRGHSSAVLAHLTAAVRADARWQLAALSPAAPDYYAHRGWEMWKGPLAIRRDGVLEPSPTAERVMVLRLPGTPAALDLHALLTAEWREGELW